MNINLKRIIFGLAIVVVAVVGGIFTNTGTEWYATLVKPSEWPPSFLFPVVWSTIYILSFVTLFLLAERGMPKSTVALFAVNGLLNYMVSDVFRSSTDLFGRSYNYSKSDCGISACCRAEKTRRSLFLSDDYLSRMARRRNGAQYRGMDT